MAIAGDRNISFGIAGMNGSWDVNEDFFTSLHSLMKSLNISIVSSGPPALSGWNWTPQTRFPDDTVDLIPSTDESLQLMKNGSHPAGNGSISSRAYW